MGSVKTPPEMIAPEEMSPRCGISQDTIRMSLRKGTFPVGFALQMDSGQWRYYIPRAEFEDWLAGKLPSNTTRLTDIIADRLADRIAERLIPNGWREWLTST